MKPYEKYVPSGVEWIGDIPEGWGVKKLKYITSLRNQKTDDADLTYIALEHIESLTGKIVKSENDELKPEGESLRFYEGDVLFCKLRPYLAKCVVALGSGKCTSELLVLDTFREINEKYLFYNMLSYGFISLVNSSTYGSKMPRANWEYVGNMLLPLPNIKTQQAIADYLDLETARIDNIIKAKETLIERLKEKRTALITNAVTKGLDSNAKMKPSRIDWIGDIPEGWKVKKIKYIAKSPLMYGANESPDDFDKEQPRYIRITDIDDKGKLRDDIAVSLDIEKARPYLLKKDDILLARSGATVGKSYIFNEDIIACFAGYMIKFEPNGAYFNPKYVYYTTFSRMYLMWIESNTIQSTIQNVSAEKYNNFQLSLPDLNTQRVIVNYLDKETEKIDATINKTAASIEKLKEYRTALISACVTGKLDVKECVAYGKREI